MRSLHPDTASIEPGQPSSSIERFDFIDASKAIGIVLVVAAHAPGAPTDAVTLIYSFHMPLFFFISGYLLAPKRAAAPLNQTVRHAARSLLVPYLFFFVVSWIYWMATRGIGERAAKFAGIEPVDALRGLATGLSSDLFVNVTLWFFPCLFMCQVIYACARKHLGAGTLLLSLALVALLVLTLSLPWHARWPWGLDIAWIALVFYATGHWLRALGWLRARARQAGMTNAIAPLTLGAIWLGFALAQGRVDLAEANFGAQPLMYLPCAMAGVGFVLAVGRLFPPLPVLRWLSDNCLIIFPLHPLFINFASGLLQLSGLSTLVDRQGLGWCLATLAWSIAASVPAVLLLKRHFPRLLGQLPKTRPRGVA